MQTATRLPAVAGAFYPADAKTLRREVEALLAGASRSPTAPAADPPKALICPHAGYVFSGPVAARAYSLLAPVRERICRVVLLGPAHRAAVRGLAIPTVAAFRTPLGDIPLDADGRTRLLGLPQVVADDKAHAFEHSLEVQLPFLQNMLDSFELLPLAVGAASPEAVGEVLDAAWGGPETLVVISSDLSHYLPYEAAQDADRASIERILAGRPLDHAQACGATPINGLLLAARRRNLRPTLLDLRNSGDTAGDRSRVVGYAALAFSEPTRPAALVAEAADDECLGTALLGLARDAIAMRLGGRAHDFLQNAEFPEILAAPGACFVTLTRRGVLRGCIGTLDACRPLHEDVRENAIGAAFRDSRFSPLRADEFADLCIGVSLLGAAEALLASSEAEACESLVPHADGVILQFAGRRATFLPQVWEQLPEPAVFLAHLMQKAGLPANFWSPDLRLYRYQVRKWTEPQ